VKIGSKGFVRLLKVPLWLLCLAPAALLLLSAFDAWGLSLGANPIEEILHRLGRWGLKFLLITLAVTPLRRWTKWNWLIAFRRLLGLFAFSYLLMHFLAYLILDQGLDLAAVLEDVAERPYITIGVAALLMLVPLAATSTRGMMRRLGRRWKKLHRLVYLVAVLGVWHFYWQVKLDTLEPTVYAVVLAILLGARVWHRWRGRARPLSPAGV
jgi:sulfoxide reductase heme-binding subunit YedZ